MTARSTRKPQGAALGWDQKRIDAAKTFVKQDLDGSTDPKDTQSRLRAVFRRLSELEEDDGDEGGLRRYVYAVSALVQHERSGGLSAKDVQHLVTLAYAILQAQGVRPRASRLAALYGDIHLIKSQIYRKEGQPWRAAWEQQVALQLAGDFPSGGLGFQLLGMANRSLRLGHARLAVAQYEDSLAHDLPAQHRARCQLGHMHALWLSTRAAEAEASAQATLRMEEVPDSIRKEIAWLPLCRSVQDAKDVNPMLAATRHGGDYNDATYIIEACIWAMTLETREFIDRLPKLGSMRRNKRLRPQRLGVWYECGVVLQECYDHLVPLPFRLRALSNVLEQRQELLTVDKELLLLAAATRWLARSKASSLAVLVYSEYRALSQRLSDGSNDDALGVLSDLKERSWLGVYYPGARSGNDDVDEAELDLEAG